MLTSDEGISFDSYSSYKKVQKKRQYRFISKVETRNRSDVYHHEKKKESSSPLGKHRRHGGGHDADIPPISSRHRLSINPIVVLDLHFVG